MIKHYVFMCLSYQISFVYLFPIKILCICIILRSYYNNLFSMIIYLFSFKILINVTQNVTNFNKNNNSNKVNIYLI